MKITVKTLLQTQFVVEANESDTVAQFKEKIAESQGAASYPPSGQKLIFSGKILEDAKSLKDYSMKENDFVVVMITKAKATPTTGSSSSSTATPVAISDAPTNTASQAAIATPTPVAASPPAAGPAPAQVSAPSTETAASADPSFGSAASALATGQVYEQSVLQLMELGYERDQVVKALRAAFNNPDRAAEYLMSGIPTNLEGIQTQPAPSTAPPGSATAPAAAPNRPDEAAGGEEDFYDDEEGGDEGADDNPLGFLRSQPQFEQLRQVVQQNPALLQPLLQRLGQANPELLNQINSNPEQFLRLLQEPASTGAQPPPNVLQVTPEERDAIQRLEGLGFPRHMVIEAYFACDKDETLAANYLFDNGNDEEMPQ